MLRSPLPADPNHRERFRQFLIDHDLPADVADAILESMPPFDWSDIARRSEMNARFDRIDGRFDRVDERLDDLRGFVVEMREFRSEFHSMSRAVVLSVMAMAVTLAVLVLTMGIAALSA